jgi:hypothetical protein
MRIYSNGKTFLVLCGVFRNASTHKLLPHCTLVQQSWPYRLVHTDDSVEGCRLDHFVLRTRCHGTEPQACLLSELLILRRLVEIMGSGTWRYVRVYGTDFKFVSWNCESKNKITLCMCAKWFKRIKFKVRLEHHKNHTICRWWGLM